jgi:hypothetical protein
MDLKQERRKMLKAKWARTKTKAIFEHLMGCPRMIRRALSRGHGAETAQQAGVPLSNPIEMSAARPVAEQLEDRRLLSVPNGPFGAAATATGTGVNVTWRDNSSDESGFVVERRIASGGYQQIGTVWQNVTSFWDGATAAGTQYTYRVHAYNAGGDSATTETNTVTTPGAAAPVAVPSAVSATSVPNGPWSLVASATSANSVSLKWTSYSNNEAGFKIERRAWSGAYQQVGTVGAGVTSWIDSSVGGSTQYTYRIKAYNNVGDSAYTNESTATTPAGAAAAPAGSGVATTVPNGPWNLIASATSANSVALKWTSYSNNESGFKIERRAWSGSYQQVVTVGAGVTSWTDSSVGGSTQYTYRVKAYNSLGDSAYTNESTAATPAGAAASPSPAPAGGGSATTVPNGPWGLAATPTSTTSVALKWTSYSNNEVGFKIERKTWSGAYQQVATVGAGVTTWTDWTAAASTQYTYRVKAYNNIGDSAYTNESVATTPSGTAAPANANPSTTWSAAETSGYFTIGVYRQPTTSFATWKARGVNTVIDFYDNPTWMEAWIASAHQYGFEEIRNPRQNIAQDKTDANLLAYEHPDEPDVNGIPLWQLQQEYAAWKAGNPNVPVLVNVAGATVIGQADQTTDQDYRNIFATSDWISNDVYPLAAWGQSSWVDKTMPNSNPWGIPDKLNEGNAVDKIRQLTGGKRQFGYVETSYQHLSQVNSGSSRAPTAGEFRGEVWNNILHGAKGIVYFPQAFNPDTTDATTPEIAAEMAVTDAKVTSFAKVLNSQSDATSNFMDLGGGLEGTWMDYNGHRYFFVLNFSHGTVSGQSFKLPGAGTRNVEVPGEGRFVWANGDVVSDSFNPYEVHVYRV